ncbi:MAG: tetrahydrofolate dehydrogenase/cyclohydrolase catalytic domain-containing protein, partial [Burkholderiales bacterium]
MTAKIIDGNAIARQVRAEWKRHVDTLRERGVVPGLAVVLVGDDSASRVYVSRKAKACGEIGIHSEQHVFAANATEDEVLWRIAKLNANPAIHGLLVQLPLPPQLNTRR